MQVCDGHGMTWLATFEPAGRGIGEAGSGPSPAVDWSIGRVVFVSTAGDRCIWLCAEDVGRQLTAGIMTDETLRLAFNCARQC